MRTEKVRTLLAVKKLDAVLISDAFNLRYISGFTGGDGFLLITKDRQILLTDARYTTQAEAEAPDYERLIIGGGKGFRELIQELAVGIGIKKLGFEDSHLSFKEFNHFREFCTAVAEWIPLDEGINALRQQKDEEELEAMRKASLLGVAAFNHVLGLIKPGLTEFEVAAEIECYMKKNGASKTSFETIVASGVHSAMPHARPTSKVLAEGDFVTMDFGCVYQGYCSDMTRTIVLGKASDRQKEIYFKVLEAQEAALAAIHAGVIGRDIDKIARDVITQGGYGEYFGHGLGHAVGMYVHEDPRFSPLCGSTIEENMILSVEPGIYIPKFGGVRIEDLVIIKKDGAENITPADKSLIEL